MLNEIIVAIKFVYVIYQAIDHTTNSLQHDYQ
jgi:hypothetical protein